MVLQLCSKHQLMEVKDEDEDGDDIVPTGFISNLLQIANDDILFEIFIRIPDCRSAILCSSVSRRCRSLISNPRFIPRFISQHQARYPPPYTIIFGKCERIRINSTSTLNLQPIGKLFSDESMFLHGKSRNSSYLDFLPSPTVVRASCDDLLLPTPDIPGSSSVYYYYICNPVTKKFYDLVQIHSPWEFFMPPIYGYALVRMPESECHFKVLLFHHAYHPNSPSEGPGICQYVTIYCSKLEKWEHKVLKYSRLEDIYYYSTMDVYECNGILYWMEYARVAYFIACDLSKCQCIFVDFPDDFGSVGLPCYHRSVKNRMGTVGGEVRLVQVVLRETRVVGLKVWRLLDNSSWILLHEKMYPRAPNEEVFVEVFVHPTDGDKVFMVWGRHVFQYDLTREDTYEMVAELQDSGYMQRSLRGIMAFPMVHPAWPTPLPSRTISV